MAACGRRGRSAHCTWGLRGRSRRPVGHRGPERLGRLSTPAWRCLRAVCQRSPGLLCSDTDHCAALPQAWEPEPPGGQAVCPRLGPGPAEMAGGVQLMERPTTWSGLLPPAMAFVRSTQQGDRQPQGSDRVSAPLWEDTRPRGCGKAPAIGHGHRASCFVAGGWASQAVGAERLPVRAGGVRGACPRRLSRAVSSQKWRLHHPRRDGHGGAQPGPSAEQTPKRQLLPACAPGPRAWPAAPEGHGRGVRLLPESAGYFPRRPLSSAAPSSFLLGVSCGAPWSALAPRSEVLVLEFPFTRGVCRPGLDSSRPLRPEFEVKSWIFASF